MARKRNESEREREMDEKKKEKDEKKEEVELHEKAKKLLKSLKDFDKFTSESEVCAAQAKRCREMGNALLAVGDDASRVMSIEVYGRGIALVNTSHYEGDEKASIRDEEAVRKNAVLREELVPLYCNRCVALLRSGEQREAVRDAEAAVDASAGENAKAHYRLAQARCALGYWREAEKSLDDAVKVDPSVQRDADAMRRRIRASERKHDATDDVGRGLRRVFAQSNEAPSLCNTPDASSGDGNSARNYTNASSDVTTVSDLRAELDEIEDEEDEQGRREREAMYNAAIRAQHIGSM